MTADRLRVVLCWHMHQPEYRDPGDGRFLAPWVYLHALKDYTDMVAHLEAHAEARATIDFVPVLIDQIDDYARRLGDARRSGVPVGDPLLDALARPVAVAESEARQALVEACLHAHRQRMIGRHPAYERLVAQAESILANRDAAGPFDDALMLDLVVWYHLAWLGESVRGDPVCRRLLEKGEDFDLADRHALIDLIHMQLCGLFARYGKLASQGRIELATAPYAHPILPLLLDFASAREARPGLPLPSSARYPGGDASVQRQLARAQAVHRRHFGNDAAGCWSPEAAISEASLERLAAAGFRWTVSSQTVLRHSLDSPTADSDVLHRPYRLNGAGAAVFFRDDELSDLIGFAYKDWAGRDAAADLIGRLEAIARTPAAPGRVVVLALDGENAWEHYEANGANFLAALYAGLTAHPLLQMSTLGGCLDDPGVPLARLQRVIAGSWVHGSFDTWIGACGRNRAWDLLGEAARCFDRADRAQQDAAERQRCVCEGSDWFWWLNEHHAEVEVARYERIYRLQLAGLYRLLGCEPPGILQDRFAHGETALAPAPTMLPHRPP
ncbi:glycoside hydrolase family 57 protein [Dokdonella immobilis]|uniref:Alpha-amylase/alpha-mannosidase, GH57 family n=1 Tax=Dokdonella immobilis TaxID=578942 RepID=A0A1I4ZBC9_9GAMM|nr:glycoside hydrolase family 57 protein [Dokdonella immobilis]SFN47594.1 Alpha-amylase/alpha-mannosidase, GH57 family [Dokdonella immobilis]